jgi:hypothetical protein
VYSHALIDVVSGTIILTICEDICTDGLGACDNDEGCNSFCIAKHPSGQGHCDIVVGRKLCYCDYTCPPSKLRIGS